MKPAKIMLGLTSVAAATAATFALGGPAAAADAVPGSCTDVLVCPPSANSGLLNAIGEVTAAADKAGGNGKVAIHEIVIVKLVDKASP